MINIYSPVFQPLVHCHHVYQHRQCTEGLSYCDKIRGRSHPKSHSAYCLFHVSARREATLQFTARRIIVYKLFDGILSLFNSPYVLKGESIHSLRVLLPIAVRHLLRTENSEMSEGSVSSRLFTVFLSRISDCAGMTGVIPVTWRA